MCISNVFFFIACEMCRKRDRADSCTHKTSIPAWQSLRKHLTLKNMYRDDVATYNQEIGGIGASLNERCFKSKAIRALMNREPLDLNVKETYRLMFISVDPSNCGLTSNVSITSTIHQLGCKVIVGAENYNCKTTDEARALLIKHVLELNRNPMIRNTTKVFILENNLTASCEALVTAIDHNLSNYIIINKLDEGNTNRRATHAVGVRTDANVKQMGVEYLNRKIKDGSLVMSHERYFTSITLTYNGYKDLLAKEMDGFRKITIENDLKKDAIEFTGKKAGTHKDDCIISLMLNIYWTKYFMSDPKYDNLTWYEQ